MTRNMQYVAVGVVAAIVVIGGYFLLTGGSNGEDASLMALEESGPLEEITLGSDDAPVTIVEYASLTCPHCGSFHRDTLPMLEKDYIGPGDVRLVMREFPLDAIATAAVMLARCAEPARRYAFLSVLFERQADWIQGSESMDNLQDIARQGGFDDARFRECLSDQEVLDGIKWVQTRAVKEFDVSSTPTFFINGEKVLGNVPYDMWQEIIDRHLESGG